MRGALALPALVLVAVGCRGPDVDDYTQAEALALLAERDAEVDDEHFIRAVRNQNPDQVALFLAAGIDPDALDGRALAMATAAGSVEVVRLLLRAGADPNRRSGSFGQTALVSATMRGRTEVIAELIAAGADPDAPSRGGTSALQFAKDAEAARLLLQAGARTDVQDVNGSTPLHGAVSIGDLELVDVLLDHGADPDVADTLGRTPRLFANIFRFGEIEERLREAGAEPVPRPRVALAKMESYAGRYGAGGELELEILFDRGALIVIQALNDGGPLYQNELLALSDTVFYRGYDPGAILFQFVVEDGRVTGITRRQGASSVFTPRLAD